MRSKEMEIELKVGLFVTIGLGLIMLAILMLGGADTFFTRQTPYYAFFSGAEGLISGAKVTLGGLSVGTIKDVDFDAETKKIRVDFVIQRKYAEWVRTDSYAEIATQGLLGDKFIALNVGTNEAKPIQPGGQVESRATQGLAEIVSKSDQLMLSLNSIAQNLDSVLKTFHANGRSETFFDGLAKTSRNLSLLSGKLNADMEGGGLKSSVRHLNAVLEKIDNGTGTLGALINDPGLYYDVRALFGGANRNRIVRNLVRQTVKENEEAEKSAKKK
jgi:phospholipid/cholesterol/gamma-HCH transport system substrate-binding protein